MAVNSDSVEIERETIGIVEMVAIMEKEAEGALATLATTSVTITTVNACISDPLIMAVAAAKAVEIRIIIDVATKDTDDTTIALVSPLIAVLASTSTRRWRDMVVPGARDRKEDMMRMQISADMKQIVCCENGSPSNLSISA